MLEKKCSKFWVLKIAGKTYTSILVPLFRSEKDLVLLVMPTIRQQNSKSSFNFYYDWCFFLLCIPACYTSKAT